MSDLFGASASNVARAIHLMGENAVYIPQDTALPAVSLVASIQHGNADALVADGDQDTIVVYVAGGDLTDQPQKFDRLEFRGGTHSIDEVHPFAANDVVLAWRFKVRG